MPSGRGPGREADRDHGLQLAESRTQRAYFAPASGKCAIADPALEMDDQQEQTAHRRALPQSAITELARRPKSRALVAVGPCPDIRQTRVAR
jgi:hypothetical protein